MVGRGLRFSRNDRTVEVIELFIIWHQHNNKAKKAKVGAAEVIITSGHARAFLFIHRFQLHKSGELTRLSI